jgi:hypothetical protein
MRRSPALGLAAAAVAAAACFTLSPSHALAATNTLTVTTTGDNITGTPVPCVISGGTGNCVTLRDAISQANTDSGDTIDLPAGTITLTACVPVVNNSTDSNGLVISAPMKIVGMGSTMTTITGGACALHVTPVQWNDTFFFTDCTDLSFLEIDGVTLTHGDASGNGGTGAENGGAVDIGDSGSCDPDVNLTMTDVNFAGNTAAVQTQAANGEGGGLNFDNGSGTLTLNKVTFGNNTANLSGGGAYISTSGAISLQNMYVHDNSACSACGEQVNSGGGGLYLEPLGGTDAATNLLISNNTEHEGSGGGIYQTDQSSKMTWSAVTLNGNTADFTPDTTTSLGEGGGFYVTGGSEADLINTTVVGNTAEGNGGGVAIGLTGILKLTFATINGNTAGNTFHGGAIYQDGTGGGQVTVSASILYQNKLSGAVSECDASVHASSGYNRSDDTSCGLTQSTDQQSSSFNPLLSGLAANTVSSGIPPTVGATADSSALTTEALQTGSPAIDQLPDPAPCVAGSTVDERGVSRPQGAACDLGAYEFIPAVITPTVPVPTTGALPPVGIGLSLLLGGLGIATLTGRRRQQR